MSGSVLIGVVYFISWISWITITDPVDLVALCFREVPRIFPEWRGTLNGGEPSRIAGRVLYTDGQMPELEDQS